MPTKQITANDAETCTNLHEQDVGHNIRVHLCFSRGIRDESNLWAVPKIFVFAANILLTDVAHDQIQVAPNGA